MKFNYITTPDVARVEVDGMRRYRWGEKLPSVTTILSAVPDQSKSIALARWRERVGEEEAERIKNTAAVRGTIMHRILEGEMTGQRHADLTTLGQEAGILAQAIIDHGFLKNLNEVWGNEIMLAYEGLYAGTADVVGVYKNQECIIDFKQSNNPKKKSQCEDYFNQAAAYAMAHNDMYGTTINAGLVLVSVMGGEIQEFWLKPDEFKARCHNWLRKVDTYWRYHVPSSQPQAPRASDVLRPGDFEEFECPSF
jgi:ATP-dependent exoDNAse (exonuclease V) beta subunit